MIYIDNKREIISTDSKLIRRKPNGAPFNRGRALPGDTADDYEEISREEYEAETHKKDLNKRYKAKIVELIRERYDQDDENGLLRQRDTKPEEFAAYSAYVEECKEKAKNFLLTQI